MFELNLSPAWADAINQRCSVRQYQSAPTDIELAQLGKLCKKVSWQGITIRMFRGPGLKSAIKGTNVYAVIIAKNDTSPELEGYMGEALVLEATSMGLSTCWLGAGFHMDIVTRNVKLQNDEHINCVIALGHAAGSPKPAGKRRSLEQLSGKNEEQLKALGAWQYAAAFAARLAPSAINQQPWKFDINETSFTISERKVLIGKYTGVDRGICMLHAAVGAASQGRNPIWKKADDGYTMRA